MNASLKLAVCFALLSPAIVAAELKPETIRAWDDYVQAASSRMAARVHDGKFLWIDDSADRSRRVRQGEVIVAPMGEHTPKGVSHGLIHDWIGSVFIPNVRLADVFDVVRDYSRYKDFYKPAVIESRYTGQPTPQEYRFSMVLLNQELFAKSALETDYKASFVQVDEKRWYSVTQTTRVQEIEDYGQASQHKLPLDQGTGFIWRIYSLTRFEERDGGVYVELEAIALSREIPISVRWIVEPLVRRIARNSLQMSLRQTVAQVERPMLQVAQVTTHSAMERR